MSLFDLQDVCIVIGSLTTLDLPMFFDLIGIYLMKEPYCTLTTTNWFLQALSVIPMGSWGDVARRFTMILWIGPFDPVSETEYNDLKNHFSEPQCKMTVLPLNSGKPRVSMAFRVVTTNQYNQDLGLIHSTNGNHLESPNEGSSIDHQVTIYLHAQNITMFPTNETWCLAQISSTRELELQRLNSYGLLIRSTTELSIPSLACTRKPTKVLRMESPHRVGRNNFRRLRRAVAGREEEKKNITRGVKRILNP
ncbi:hypothetical protein F511_19099 [Dorcoceras hygrometricum]|uniref:Uncharacterized protein n=1 Tax=Dorcoceras hygrometricum TaxID=472368 RepID=A0A2Z7ASW0_9LAMI|nr:hypothetical protein F511_19099 [Dorcoceras hygrometricum]